MIVIGLTGSIGMGKSEVCRMFAGLGVPVHDADAAVHDLYAPGGAAVAPVQAAFPGTVTGGAVDRDTLSRRVVGDSQALARLEAIVHPLVRDHQRRFLDRAAAAGERMVVLDIPLLYESGGEDRVDYVVVVSAPYEIQSRRVLARTGMTEEKFQGILAEQMPDDEKRRRADYVVPTDGTLQRTLRYVRTIVKDLSDAEGRKRPDSKD